MNSPVRHAAILHIVFACFCLIDSLIAVVSGDFTRMGTLPNMPASASALITGISLGIALLLILLLIFFNIACAVGCLNGNSSARIGLLIFSFLLLLSYPIGTAIGAYSFWAIYSSRRKVQKAQVEAGT